MIRPVLAAVAAVVLSSGVAHADPPPPWTDSHYPDWQHGNCAGGHAAFGGCGYCDGEHYPDGSYWHQVRGAGMDALKPHCVIDDDSPQPPPAPKGGCGGNSMMARLMDTLSSFDEVVSAWDKAPCCQSAQTRRPCRNHVRWLAVGNHQLCYGQRPTVLLCSFHKTRWLRIVWEKIAYHGYFQCCCGERFTTPEQTVMFRPV